MNSNPYKYKGPLDPKEDQIVCVPRAEEVVRVLQGIERGDYFSVLGPRQIGKTTFLRQIKKEIADRNKIANAYPIEINFEVIHSRKEDFFRWLKDQVIKAIPSEKEKVYEWDDKSPEFSFIEFLRKFKPKEDTTKIVFLFDEIDEIPFLREYLHVWRKIFHDRFNNKELDNYSVIAAGSADLIALTLGPNSPFNIAEMLYLKDFSMEESRKLVGEPFKQSGFEIEEPAKEKLLSQISGHPQMLQHACYLLFDKAKRSQKSITVKDVDEAIENLLQTNASIDTLKQEIKLNDILETLLRDILEGKKIKYHPNKEFSVLGAGAIVEKNSFCKVRNNVYRRFFIDMFEIWPGDKLTQNEISSPSFINFSAGISSVLFIIIGFISTLTESQIGMYIAASLALIAFVSFIRTLFTGKSKSKRIKKDGKKQK